VRGVHIRDHRAIGYAHVWIGLDPFGAQPLHLGAPFVDFEHAVYEGALVNGCDAPLGQAVCSGRGAVRRRALVERGLVVLLLVSRYGHVTILSSGLRLSSDRPAPGGPATAD